MAGKEEQKKRVHIFVSGRVQGVFYRMFLRKQAREINVDGWCRNLSDGRVEIVAEGGEYHINRFIEICKEGNTLAKIDDADIREEKPTGKLAGFEIIY